MYQFKANIFTILNSLIEQNIIQNHIIANVQCHKKFKLIAMEGPDDKKDRQSLTLQEMFTQGLIICSHFRYRKNLNMSSFLSKNCSNQKHFRHTFLILLIISSKQMIRPKRYTPPIHNTPTNRTSYYICPSSDQADDT